MEKYNAFNWLTQCPTNDGNYSTALERASVEDLRRAVSFMAGSPGNKGRIASCERELKKRARRISAAIAYFEDAVRESDEIIADCSPKLQADLIEQKGHFVAMLEFVKMERAQDVPREPLTMEDLRERDGKPVYVVFDVPGCGKDWGIVSLKDNGVVMVDGVAPFEGCGSVWNAYDRPPTESLLSK